MTSRKPVDGERTNYSQNRAHLRLHQLLPRRPLLHPPPKLRKPPKQITKRDLFYRMKRLVAKEVVDAAFERHRLAYMWEDDDTIGEDGKPTPLFVCKCTEAFDRSAYNRHIRDKYKEVV